MFRFLIALWVSKCINAVIKLVAPSRGSNYAGRIAVKLDPQFVAHVRGIDPERVLFITGTNGKSTTTNLIHHILKQCDVPVVSNIEGANMLTGIARMLLNSCSLTGRAKDAWYICETDERSLPAITPQLRPGHFLAVNLTEDQVQRNGDPSFVLDHIRSALPEGLTMYLNHDEPRSLTLGDTAKRVVTFSVAPYRHAYAPPASLPAIPCPRCYHPLTFKSFNNQGQGVFGCEGCGYDNAAPADYTVEVPDDADRTFRIGDQRYPMPLDLPYMVYNEAAAIAVAEDLVGLAPEDVAEALTSFCNIAGRYEVFRRGDKTLKSLRIKQENPETLQNVLHVIASDPEPKIVVLALLPVEDFKPWYMNVAYLLSCDVAPMLETPITRIYHVGEAVAYDTRRFFDDLGVPPETNILLPGSDVVPLLEALDEESCDNIYIVPSVNFYKAMVDQVKEGGLTSPCPERLRSY